MTPLNPLLNSYRTRKKHLTYTTRLLEKDVPLVDIQALLGHESIATTQIYTHAGQERLSKLVEGI